MNIECLFKFEAFNKIAIPIAVTLGCSCAGEDRVVYFECAYTTLNLAKLDWIDAKKKQERFSKILI